MGNFFSDLASYSRPAEYIPRNIELEGTYQALKDYTPDLAQTVATGQVKRGPVKYLDLHGNELSKILQSQQQDLNRIYTNIDQKTQPLNQSMAELQEVKSRYSGMLQPFADAATQVEDYRESLNKRVIAGKISTDKATMANEMVNFGAIKNIQENTGIPNPSRMFLPFVPDDVNPHTVGTAAFAAVAEEIREYFNPQEWKPIQANPTTLLNYSTTIKQRTGKDIREAVVQRLMNERPLIADLNFQAATELFVQENQAASPEEKEAIRQNREQLASEIVINKINEVVNSLGETGSFKDVTFQHSTTSIPQWALGFMKDSSGNQFTIPRTDVLGEAQDKNILENYNDDGTLKKRRVIGTTQRANIPSGQLALYSSEPNAQDVQELQRKYPEIAQISKTPKELISNIKNALNQGKEYTYNLTFPEKVIVSKYLQSAANSLTPVKADKNWSPTDEVPSEEEIKQIKSASFKLDPIKNSGQFKVEIGDNKYILQIPQELKRNLQPTYDLYAAGQRVWQTGKPDFVQIAGVPATIKREFNSDTKKYDLTIYHPYAGVSKFTDELTRTTERSLKSIIEQTKALDLEVEDFTK